VSSTLVLHVPRPSRVSASLAARLGPPVLDSLLVSELLERYGLRASGSPRNLRLGRRSLNVAVRTDGGTKVVKRYRPEWGESTVRYGHSIVDRLAELNVPAARLVRAPDGATWTSVGGAVFAVFDYIPGTNYSLNFLLRDDRLWLTRLAGRTLARFHRALHSFVPVGEHHMGFASRVGPRRRDPAWHAAKLDELRRRSADLTRPEALPYIERLRDAAGGVLDAIERLDRHLADASFTRLVIHGDYGLHNLIFQPTGDAARWSAAAASDDGWCALTAVPVDFEMSRLDWRINDLISVLGKHRYRGGRYDDQSMATFLAAYAAAFPLTRDERDLLPDAWRLYKLQAAIQYWSSYFETDGPVRKLASALDALDQADLVLDRPEPIRSLGRVAREPARGAAR
jgi:Ser/Thr protein kinase RdoA (MazF antagonist)